MTINEDFAVQVISPARHLEVPWEKLNVNGGATALGHPYRMTGARIMTTLLNSLQTAHKTLGLETICVAGGQGTTMIVERLN
jgi:acetyl-CoA C-acetyltransferase